VLLLDTHVWIWTVEADERRVGHATRRQFVRAASGDGLRISPVSLFEVTALHANERLQLSRPLGRWLHDGLEHVRIAEVTAEIAIDAGQLPRTALSDPMDRLLVATARQLECTLVTADRAILAYARGGHVRIHDASR
jgi:PIN domain nuclease of toxin-antitoxin system